MSNYDDTLEQVVEMAVEGMNSYDIRQLAEELPENQSDCAEAFCKRFSLGYWLMETFDEYDTDIVGVLSRFADNVAAEETEEEIEARLIETSMRQSQGWVH